MKEQQNILWNAVGFLYLSCINGYFDYFSASFETDGRKYRKQNHLFPPAYL